MKFLYWILALLSILNAQDLMLLKEFNGEDLSGFVMSEKYDGVRAFWNGEILTSRNGKILNAPKWWIENLPKDISLDGELWSKRGEFQRIISIVNDKIPSKQWQDIKFMIFDSPDFTKPNHNNKPLNERLAPLKAYLATLESNPNIQIIEQIEVKNNESAFAFLEQVINNGGEGIVVRKANAPYISGRSGDILKLKKMKDSECEIIAINEGKGKFKGLMGSVTCRDIFTKEIFKIGSGFSINIRKNPPKIGTIITYKFQNLTNANKPRFPVFMRIAPKD